MATDVKRVPVEQGVQAGLRTDLLSPKFFNYLYTITDSILISQGGGGAYSQKLYDDLETDAHVMAVLHKRKMAVIAAPWGLEPASMAKKHLKQAQVVYEFLEDLNIDKVSYDLLDAVLKGNSVVEIVWKIEDEHVRPVAAFPRDARRFEFREDQATGNPIVMLKDWENQFPGQDAAARKFMLHSWGAKDSNPHGFGLGNRLFWPVFFKKQAIALWQIYLEKFAVPTVKGEYEPQALDKTEQANLLNALSQITQDAALMVPKGTIVELLEPQRQGSMSPFERCLRWFDEQISEAVLGETLTTNAGRTGSHAAAQVHDDIRVELSKLDMAMVNATIQRDLIQWIMDLNFPGEDAPIFYRKLDDASDGKSWSEVLVNLGKVGFSPTPEYIMRRFGDGFRQSPLSAFQNTTVQAGKEGTDPGAPSDYKIISDQQPGGGDSPMPSKDNSIRPRPGSNSVGVLARTRG